MLQSIHPIEFTYVYVTGFDKSQLPRTQWQGWLFTTTRFLHQLTNNPCVYHCHCFPDLLFLGLVSRAYLTCSSARVVFKWQWCEQTSTHPARNCHTTGQKAWRSNWLLFVTFRAQMGLRWDLLVVSTSTRGGTRATSVAPYHPRPPPLWSFVIVV